MNILKENYKIIDGKIDLFRNEMFSLIARLKSERIDGYESTILTSLELANLQAWNAQIINNGFQVPPFIEPQNPIVFLGELPPESIFKKVSKCLVYLYSTITAMSEMEFCEFDPAEEDYLETLPEKVLKEEISKILNETDAIESKTVYYLSRALDCLNDVILWTKLEMERTNE